MPRRTADRITFRYRTIDSDGGVTRATTKRLAARLGVTETQAIHRALRELALRLLPRYERDPGPLTVAQLGEIRNVVPQGTMHSVRSSIIEAESNRRPRRRVKPGSR